MRGGVTEATITTGGNNHYISRLNLKLSLLPNFYLDHLYYMMLLVFSIKLLGGK